MIMVTQMNACFPATPAAADAHDAPPLPAGETFLWLTNDLASLYMDAEDAIII